MRVKYFDFLTYSSPVKDASEVSPYSCSYRLPYICISENRWNSNIVEGITIMLWIPPVYGIWFPICFVVQSLIMIPLHIYKGVYNCLYFLDKYLY